MTNEHKKLMKKIEIFNQSIQRLELTGDHHRILENSKGYKSDRNRIHKEILRKYADLFAVIQNIRMLCVLGVQNIDLLAHKCEADFINCIKRYKALDSMMIKYRDVFDEIICLIENGFPDGAMQRWRTFLEYSIIIIFILEQGEEVADAYYHNFIKSMEDELRPRTNYAWANAADCLKEEKQIRITMLLENIQGFDINAKKRFLGLYKWISQSIHGSSVGINLSFNDSISYDINDLHTKKADYFAGGISTVISNTMYLFIQTFIIYFNAFPNGGLDIKSLLKKLSNEYVKIYKMHVDTGEAFITIEFF